MTTTETPICMGSIVRYRDINLLLSGYRGGVVTELPGRNIAKVKWQNAMKPVDEWIPNIVSDAAAKE